MALLLLLVLLLLVVVVLLLLLNVLAHREGCSGGGCVLVGVAGQMELYSKARGRKEAG